MTPCSCHTPLFGCRDRSLEPALFELKSDFRRTISMTGVSDDVPADCKARVYVKLIAFVMRDLCRKVDVYMGLVSFALKLLLLLHVQIIAMYFA